MHFLKAIMTIAVQTWYQSFNDCYIYVNIRSKFKIVTYACTNDILFYFQVVTNINDMYGDNMSIVLSLHISVYM